MLLLTVAVCTYRRFDLAEKCLRALERQTLDKNLFSITVVDNSLTRAESEKFRDSLRWLRNLEYVITDRFGLSFARNVALQACRSPIIAFIDDDAVPDDNWAEMIASAFVRYPAAGVVGGRVLPLWEMTPPNWLKGPLLNPLAVVDWGDKECFVDHHSKWLVGANIAYRTSPLKRSGGFNTALGRSAYLLFAHEELAANISLQQYGYDAIYVPSIKVDHLIQAERCQKDWLAKNAIWEGASRILYELNASGLDTKSLSNVLSANFLATSKKITIPDETEAIVESLRVFQNVGRKATIKFLGSSLAKRRPLCYFSDVKNVIYIVTPSLNAREHIDQTILSVISQSGDFSIRYHVQDGGSSDGTIERLTAWKERLDRGDFPISCKNILFTFGSASDRGMYSAISVGFESMSIPPEAFMTWINSDDILMPSALATIHSISDQIAKREISWVSGAACIIRDNVQIVQSLRNIPTDVIKAGLCDGHHWTFVQQEGTFFRKWLYDTAGAQSSFDRYTYAADWNLWRLFAHYADFVTVEWPLGAFRIRDSQLSQVRRESYLAEIDREVSVARRADALRKFTNKKDLKSVVLRFHYPETSISLTEKNSVDQAKFFFDRYLRRPIPIQGKLDQEKERGAVLFDINSEGHPEKCSKPKDLVGNLPFTAGPRNINQKATLKRFKSNFTALPRPVGEAVNFFVVTPCLNAFETIDQTIKSIVSQEGQFYIHYHVQDGGSTDGTLERLRNWENVLTRGNIYLKCSGLRFSWSSQQDMGIYDAIEKGFDAFYMSSDDFMCWINADDLLLPGSLFFVQRASCALPEVEWFGGPQYVLQGDELILQRDVPTPTALIREGLCDGLHWPFLQQEGIFFKKRLWFKGKHSIKGFKLAGDWSLWREFAQHTKYYQIKEPLGAFMRRKGQISVSHFKQYVGEIDAALPFDLRRKAFQRIQLTENMTRQLIVLNNSSGVVVTIEDHEGVKKELQARSKKTTSELST